MGRWWRYKWITFHPSLTRWPRHTVFSRFFSCIKRNTIIAALKGLGFWIRCCGVELSTSLWAALHSPACLAGMMPILFLEMMSQASTGLLHQSKEPAPFGPIAITFV
ncbi:conserved hypothetical protein [Yersinia pestis biovar Antiqua str. UG05-0454]|uniref:Uncharacterized protein n=1 Tax=Yersinia pestis bv. Antiqua (strain Antiqua) TaxID=360102 RepID=A0A0H2YEL4_YERPA|nr:hypothetical protein YPA_MT0093 [Yersinia pestis Antiqua]EDR59480.1 conserved hypothetical protein [Yersinia pestis biovar Antiqua str. UG05-0454]